MSDKPVVVQRRGRPRTVAEANARFAESLVGWWRALVGTFGVMMDETWVFRRDGTGERVETSVMSGTTTSTFRWEQAGRFRVRIWWLSRVSDPPRPEVDDDGSNPGEEVVETLVYGFVAERTDTHAGVGLVRAGTVEGPGGLMSPPLEYVGAPGV